MQTLKRTAEDHRNTRRLALTQEEKNEKTQDKHTKWCLNHTILASLGRSPLPLAN